MQSSVRSRNARRELSELRGSGVAPHDTAGLGLTLDELVVAPAPTETDKTWILGRAGHKVADADADARRDDEAAMAAETEK